MFRAYAVQKAKKTPTKQKMFLKGTCQQPSLAEGLIHFGRLHEHALDLGCGVPNGISASPEHHSSYTQGGCARNVHSQHTPASLRCITVLAKGISWTSEGPMKKV